jgi:formylglycine-generating enzyme required for sulfatase activity
MNVISNLKYVFSVFLILILLNSCGMPKAEDYSVTTGWAVNWQQNGGFEAKLKNGSSDENAWKGTKIPSNMVFVQGGTFVMGKTQEDVMQDGNNFQKEATVSSFWMDQTEITNLQYREYTDWMQRVFWEDGEGEFSYLYAHALPDSTVWRSELSFNEPMVTQYFRHPAYQDYPVVGVSWQQAVDYCDWRTDRVNERRLIESGALGKPEKAWKKYKEGFMDDADVVGYFNTLKYLKYGEYNLDNWEKPDEGKRGLRDLSGKDGDEPSYRKKMRKIKIEDGIFTTPYRLPTEAEWEYAAVAGYNTTVNLDGNQHGKFYPWRSFDADYHQANGSKSGRNSLRQPYDGNRFDIKRQQYGKLRGDNKQNAFINAITDGASVEGNNKFGSRSHIEYDNYMMTPTYRDISFEEMRTGQFLANFRHGRGDYAGVSPVNNDLGTMTMPVGSFPPNDWGLYDMAGNVNEWVMDVYRPLTPMASNDLNPFRGNLFKQVARGDDGYVRMLEDLDDSQAKALGLMAENGEYIFPANPGMMIRINEQIDGNDDPIDDNMGDRFDSDRYNWNDETPHNIHKGRDNGESYNYENSNSTHSEENYNNVDNRQYGRDAYDFLTPKSTNPRSSPKRNYTRANNIDYRDGEGSTPIGADYSGWGVYDYGRTTLVNNYTRVYKGGSWQDDAYWLSPGTKRFLNEDLAKNDVGFRCVIDHLGYVSGGEYEQLGKSKNKDRYNRNLWKYKTHDNDNKNIE